MQGTPRSMQAAPHYADVVVEVSRFLVDTQLLLWNVYGSRKLPARVARLFRDGRHEFFYSAATLWEIAIKAGRGREDFIADTGAIREALEANGFQELVVAGHGRGIQHLVGHVGRARQALAQRVREPHDLGGPVPVALEQREREADGDVAPAGLVELL